MSLTRDTYIILKGADDIPITPITLLEAYPPASHIELQSTFVKHVDKSALQKPVFDGEYKVYTPSGNWVSADFHFGKEDYRYTLKFENGTEATISEFQDQPAKKYADEEEQLIRIKDLKVGNLCPFIENIGDKNPKIYYSKIIDIKYKHPFDDLVRLYINTEDGRFVLANGLITHI